MIVRGEGRGARPVITGKMSARKREKFRHVCGTVALFAERLTVTIAGRKSGEPLAESFEMRILSDFVSKRVPHAFRRCRD